jgi:(2Fe-2S) ferredoxin
MGQPRIVDDGRVGIVVCRGCCCGTPDKRPEVDHAARLNRWERFARDRPTVATVRTSPCLGPCEHADVVVVLPSRAARRRGARPAWFGLVDDHALGRLLSWVVEGGPGVVMPDDLALNQISRPGAEHVRAAAQASGSE